MDLDSGNTRQETGVMRRAAILTLALLCAPGCLVLSLQPAYDDETIAWDPELVGSWVDADDNVTMDVERGEWKSYRIKYVHPIETATVTGCLQPCGYGRGCGCSRQWGRCLERRPSSHEGSQMFRTAVSLAAAVLLTIPAAAQNRSEDEYTRYELLAPETSAFKIIYDVTAVTPGAKFFFNPIRIGSVASDESVIDLMTGAPLTFDDISGAEARESGLTNADLKGRYIRVRLARPVPSGGEGRIRIIKTYKDPKSYYRDGDAIVFDRGLGIKRNSVILPSGYELVSCNIPSQVLEEADGRIGVSFMNTYPNQAPLVVRGKAIAKRAPPPPSAATTAPTPTPGADASAPPPAMERVRVPERAFQDREIVYFLKEPQTHAFSLYHDFTEVREGYDKYLNIVRRGSTVSDPSAKNLDTGEALTVETLKGAAITKAAIDIGEPVHDDSEVVVVRFPAVRKGQSLRLRIEETYTDPARYDVRDGQLMWRRSFGRPRNDIVLPAGWYVTTSSIPAVVSQMSDGRIRLAYVNPRPDSIDVFVKGRMR